MMIYPLTVTPDELREIKAAEEKGVDFHALIISALSTLRLGENDSEGLDPPSRGNDDATLALLDEWLKEAETDDPEEIAAAEKELAEFKSTMNAERKRAGARPLY